jgi:hypothetical protein
LSYRMHFMAALCAATASVLSFGAAQAASSTPFNGTISADYGHIGVSHDSSADFYGVGLTGTVPLNIAHAKFEGDGSFHNLAAHGLSHNEFKLGGHLFWSLNGIGRAGASVGYSASDMHNTALTGIPGLDHVTNYGAFGQYYVGDKYTLSAKGGGFTGDHSDSGYYVGGQATAYATPDVAVNGAIDYTDVNRLTGETDYSVTGEWLVSETTPFSIYGGYTYAQYSDASVDANVWMIGLRFYTDGKGLSLEQHHRSGTLGWAGSFSPAVLR